MVKVKRKNISAPITEDTINERVQTDLFKHDWMKDAVSKYGWDESAAKDVNSAYIKFRDLIQGESRGQAMPMFKQFIEQNNGVIPKITTQGGTVTISGKGVDSIVVGTDWKHGIPVIDTNGNTTNYFINNGTIVSANGEGASISNLSVANSTTAINNIGNNNANAIGGGGKGNADAITPDSSAHVGTPNDPGANPTPSAKPTPGPGGNNAKPTPAPDEPGAPDETPAETPPAVDDGSDWLSFFTSKEVLITVGVITAIAGILYGLNVLKNTIKARFRKTARVLYRLQKDFGGSPNGLDMKNALGGVGSKITDVLVKMFGRGEKGKGAIGIVPFVQNYRDELKRDYISSRKAFDMVAAAGKEEVDASIPANKSESYSSNVKVFNSFNEAINYQRLNEGKEPVNESVTFATVMTGITLGRLAFKAGQYFWNKRGKNGEEQQGIAVQVTKQSTREVCFAIMNCFFAKYFNLEGVSAKLGMDVKSLGDIDKSNVDKLQKLAQAMKQEQSNNANVSMMYSRVKNMYFKMLEHYIAITRNLVKNFEKYSKSMKTKDGKGMSEKDDNLLTSGAHKLYAELERQEDLYKNNFFRVVNAIVASPEYIDYIDFIIKEVIPVFKTGLASDADFVLDTLPRVGEYYVVTQTNQYQNGSDDSFDKLPENGRGKGNIAIIKILGVDKEGKNNQPVVKFSKEAILLVDVASLNVGSDGTYDLSSFTEDNYNVNAYRSNGDDSEPDVAELPYGKWLALDPYIAKNCILNTKSNNQVQEAPDMVTMERNNNGTDEFLFIIPSGQDNQDENSKPNYSPDIKINEDDDNTDANSNAGNDNTSTQNDSTQTDGKKIDKITFFKNVEGDGQPIIIDINADGKLDMNQFIQYAQNHDADDNNNKMGFTVIEDTDKAKQIINVVKNKQTSDNTTSQTVQSNEEIPPIINGQIETGEDGEKNLNHIKAELLGKAENLANEVMQQIKTNIVDKAGDSNFQQMLILKGSAKKSAGQNYDIYEVRGIGKTINDDILPNLQTNDKISLRTGVIIIDTGVKTITNNKSIMLIVKPKIYNYKSDYTASTGSSASDPNNSPQVSKFKINLFVYLATTNGTNFDQLPKIQKTQYYILTTTPILYTDTENLGNELAKTIKSVIGSYYNLTPDGKFKNDKIGSIIEESISYEVNGNIFEMQVKNFVSIKRHISSSIDTTGLYILAEQCWGDGTHVNPTTYLNESFNKLVNNTNYYDIAKIVKNTHNMSLIPFNESTILTVGMPYNRYNVLSNGCPMFEHIAYVKFDSTADKNVDKIYEVGVHKFIK